MCAESELVPEVQYSLKRLLADDVLPVHHAKAHLLGPVDESWPFIHVLRVDDH